MYAKFYWKGYIAVISSAFNLSYQEIQINVRSNKGLKKKLEKSFDAKQLRL